MRARASPKPPGPWAPCKTRLSHDGPGGSGVGCRALSADCALIKRESIQTGLRHRVMNLTFKGRAVPAGAGGEPERAEARAAPC